ncbi:MAG TPA: pyrroline-5-carboxylate reductase [Caulobacteraceae bacterium]
MSGLPKVGFIGVGTIAEALVTGLCRDGDRRADILLSPRNARIAEDLAGRFPQVRVAADNQAVLDASEVVVLAVTPQVADEVLGALSFRGDHRIVSLVATYDLARLRPLVEPARAIVRAAPLPAVAERLGPLVMHPPAPEIAALFEGLGLLVQVEEEADMDAFLAVTALMGSYFGLLDQTAAWLGDHVADGSQVQPYVSALFHALGVTAQARAAGGFDRLVAEHSTPQGLNEQAFRELKAAGWTRLVAEILDLIHARIQRRATFADRLGDHRA